MRRSNHTQRGPLPQLRVRATAGDLTRFAGLTLLIEFCFERLKLVEEMRQVVGAVRTPRVFGVHLVLLAFLFAQIAGVHRLRHIAELRGDAVMEKWLRLPRWPSRKVLSLALAFLPAAGIRRLEALVTRIGVRSLTDLPTDGAVIIDVDTINLECYGQQEGALFGYCNGRRNRRRHSPITASVALTRAVLLARYRDGSAMNGTSIVEFLEEVRCLVQTHLPHKPLWLRLDSGFYSQQTTAWLLRHHIPYLHGPALS